MYRQQEEPLPEPSSLKLPFEGKLSSENRWVIMSNIIPWSEFEGEYAKNFSERMGPPALPFRMALGALIIKEKLRISDEETVEQIRENPYLQYFIGLTSYQEDAPFDASMMVHFRKRINSESVNKINEKMVEGARKKLELEEKEKRVEKEREEEKGDKENKGKLILDATCAPADLRYPTDLEILNQGREGTEKILDCLYKEVKEKLKKKPRTHRKIARKNYLKVAKNRNPSYKVRRKAIGQQLKYIKNNLGYIDQLLELGASLTCLNKRLYRLLLVIQEVYRQQQEMWEKKEKRIDHRIVSLSQPHVRPIVRGKAGKPTEFGAKLSVSYVEQFVFLDRLSWENFNESQDLKAQIEKFKDTYGCYPESVHVDKIYRTRENRAWCKERGIRISGIPLGRPPKNQSSELKKQAKLDEAFRNRIEGKFGQTKRRFGLNRVMAKLLETSETSIAITFLIVNLSTLLRQILLSLFVKNQENHFSEDSALLILMLFEDSQQYNLSLKPPNFPLAS